MQFRQFPRHIRRPRALHPPELSAAARTRLQALTVWQQIGDSRFAWIWSFWSIGFLRYLWFR